jgi:chromosome segregation ATPase
MIPWPQYFGAFLTGSGGAALVTSFAQLRRASMTEHALSTRSDALDRHQLIGEASEILDDMRHEIERLKRDLAGVRTECEARQVGLRADMEIMHREVAYWQQVAGELRRDNASLRAEVQRLTARVKELEQIGEQHGA